MNKIIQQPNLSRTSIMMQMLLCKPEIIYHYEQLLHEENSRRYSSAMQEIRLYIQAISNEKLSSNFQRIGFIIVNSQKSCSSVHVSQRSPFLSNEKNGNNYDLQSPQFIRIVQYEEKEVQRQELKISCDLNSFVVNGCQSFQEMLIETQADLEFLEVCYETLMIIKECVPQLFLDIRLKVAPLNAYCCWEGAKKIKDQQLLKTQKSSQELVSFQEVELFIQEMVRQKHEEYIRRLNSNLGSIVLGDSNDQKNLKFTEINQILFHLTQSHYDYKKQDLAYKILASDARCPLKAWVSNSSRSAHQVLDTQDDKYIEFFKAIGNQDEDQCLDTQRKSFAMKIVEKLLLKRELHLIGNGENANSQEEEDQIRESHGQQVEEQLGLQRLPLKEKKSFEMNASNTNYQFQNSYAEQSVQSMKNSPKRNPSQRDSSSKVFKRSLGKNTQKQKIPIQSILFQLKESHNIERVAELVAESVPAYLEQQQKLLKGENKYLNEQAFGVTVQQYKATLGRIDRRMLTVSKRILSSNQNFYRVQSSGLRKNLTQRQKTMIEEIQKNCSNQILIGMHQYCKRRTYSETNPKMKGLEPTIIELNRLLSKTQETHNFEFFSG